MSKKGKNTTMSFRVGSEKEKRIIKKKLQEYGYTEAEAINCFLEMVEDTKMQEASTLLKKAEAIEQRNKLLSEANGLNNYIRALNLRLKNLNETRYEDLSENDSLIYIYDSNGDEIDLNKLTKGVI